MKLLSVIRRHSHTLAFTCVGMVGAVMSFLLVGASGADDPYISYFVADMLAKTGKLVNYSGDAIEQSSSFVHVLLLALLHVVTRLSVPLLAALMGFAAFIATVHMAGVWASRSSRAAGYVAAGMVGVAHPLIYWAAGALETLLVPLFLLLFLQVVHRALDGEEWNWRTYIWCATVSFFFAAVRPDALLILVSLLGVLGVFVGVSVLVPRAMQRAFPAVNAAGYVRVLATSLVSVVLLEGTRLAVFGELMPQPVRAKSGFQFAFGDGWKYVSESMPPAWLTIPLSALLLLGVVRTIMTKSLMGWLTCVTAAGWLVLVMGSGGDWMGMGRLLISVFVMCLVLCAVGVVWAAETIARCVKDTNRTVARRVAVVILSAGIVAPEVVASVFLATNPGYFNSNLRTYLPIASDWTATNPISERSLALPSDVPWYQYRNSSHLRDELYLRKLEPWLTNFLAEHPRKEPYVIGAVQAGMVPYYIFLKFHGKIHFIDMASLSTNDFPDCKELERSPYGRVIWMWQWRKWAGDCAPPLPDMYFGHGDSNKNTVGDEYSVAVSQDLDLDALGRTTYASLVLFVRNELLN